MHIKKSTTTTKQTNKQTNKTKQKQIKQINKKQNTKQNKTQKHAVINHIYISHHLCAKELLCLNFT